MKRAATPVAAAAAELDQITTRSEEHTSELQSPPYISYAARQQPTAHA